MLYVVCRTLTRWGGRVLYGDTDSLFVLLENKSLAAAFEIGREIAYTVTQQNPAPVELQLEKVGGHKRPVCMREEEATTTAVVLRCNASLSSYSVGAVVGVCADLPEGVSLFLVHRFFVFRGRQHV